MTSLRNLLPLLLVLFLSACSLFPEKDDETIGWSANKFYTEASTALAEGDYEAAIKYYEKLEARYPFGRYAMQAQLDVAYAYYKGDEPEQAIAAANRFIKLNPRHPYVDYAFYLKGIVNFNRSLGFLERYLPIDSSQRDPGAAMESFKDFSELIRLFPDSEYSADARKRLDYLRNNLAQLEVHVARYYMKREAYLAAAKRAAYVVERFERTPAVEEALTIMVEAYKKLGMDDLAADAERVLTLNREQGTFEAVAAGEEPEKEAPLTRKMWDYLQLDQN